ncbi:8-oxo-dGDP phosphatase NUDT18 [Schistocerca americana]|uniref:8-oxo-dGDP phosphatase NUDT18 n=1 Tax=Schistocerca americana TaxID=7009 RepID=UPI001F5019EC|nr:8-oxo-dGDP phosphatase NUDT18 [Schistocerca americana]XP_047102373.1 8-oxo-dGDP phosphatase NUDT18 [Schistocerca piceifrons]XP_049781154.1 8-oxo-dGDP phosphatase NUDT18 [Schistocerca cancellata]
MDRIEDTISAILNGLAADETQDYCDFTLEEQNEASAAKGITPCVSSDYVPLVKSTVTYIVIGVLMNEEGEILMMQEAKSSCYGQWYLPAGRVEPGEEIEEAVKREVLEETGIIMEPKSLLLVETASGSWFRFVIVGDSIGGELKTPDKSDDESLQAQWVKDVEKLCLRSSDIVPIIERARAYNKSPPEPWHGKILPVIKGHQKLLLRLLVCIKKRSNNRVHILLSEKNDIHLPLCEINPRKSLHSILKTFMTEIFGADVAPHKPHGVLSVEFSGRPEGINDGVCLTILVSFRKPLEEVGIIDKYTWLEVSETLGNEILNKLPKNMVTPLNVIR